MHAFVKYPHNQLLVVAMLLMLSYDHGTKNNHLETLGEGSYLVQLHVDSLKVRINLYYKLLRFREAKQMQFSDMPFSWYLLANLVAYKLMFEVTVS